MAEIVGRRLILASQSRSRQTMLAAAGVVVEAIPSDVDEPALRRKLEAYGAPPEPETVAMVLAEAKALSVSRGHRGALVIGGDQVLALGRRIFEKPVDLSQARHHLLDLRGQSHDLISAVVLAEDGEIVWRHSDRATLAVRAFGLDFLDSYLERAGADLCQSVGAYQLEGVGVQLFERIDGDYFTILGMPLVALLQALRERGVLQA